MSRSGTSLTTRILNVLGVDLGAEEDLLEPIAAENPSGFWEHERIMKLNEEILATFGDAPPLGAWRWLPSLPPGWERDSRLEPHRHTASSLLKESFAERPLWGWKDPRNCLTLPFWQRLVPEMRYVICVRHPLDVADSLKVRNGISREEALQLWLRYMSHAVLHTSDRRRVFVSYEDYFPSWEYQTMRLTQFLGLPVPSDAQRAAIADHFDDRLWHYRAARRGMKKESLPSEAGNLYTLLSALCDTDPEPGAERDLDDAARRAAECATSA